ncbi:uncharacterized protein LOC127136649 [Lathyrus oleraceus]|uniref:uncharacterized protein LOC127136649 n=1 Tax=Pisum sativum TaxID=3888 RepID=UPI0021D31BC9|nr:uncharacterized protein LOC127136649 [Pisum sativum]
MAEYEACIFGIEASIDLGIKILEVYRDSALVISQVKEDWDTRDHKLIAYKEHVLKLFLYFDEITFHHIPREENHPGDVLATLAFMFKLYKNFKIDHHNSSPYRPKMNGVIEETNENIKNIVQKMVETYKDWHEMLPFTLHGYRTPVRTSTGATSFSLVYGMDVVFPVEVGIPSLRILTNVKLNEAEWLQTRFDQLDLIDEKCLAAICHGQLYQKRIKRANDKKVFPRSLEVGDLVLKKILPIHTDPMGKWTPNYEDPYVVIRVFFGGALILATMDGEYLPSSVNLDAVKKY